MSSKFLLFFTLILFLKAQHLFSASGTITNLFDIPTVGGYPIKVSLFYVNQAYNETFELGYSTSKTFETVKEGNKLWTITFYSPYVIGGGTTSRDIVNHDKAVNIRISYLQTNKSLTIEMTYLD